MTKTFFGSTAAALFWCLAVSNAAAQGGHHGEGHSTYHSWYEGLIDYQGISCCNDRDCRPTEHRALADGTIEVMVDGNWMTVPPETILQKSAPDLGSHVCATPSLPWQRPKILCVVLGNGV